MYSKFRTHKEIPDHIRKWSCKAWALPRIENLPEGFHAVANKVESVPLNWINDQLFDNWTGEDCENPLWYRS